MLPRPTLSLAEIEAFDPHGPPHRRCCPLCGADKPKDAAHRSLSLNRASGVWNCFRCGQGGKVKEAWQDTGTGSSFGLGREARQNKLRAAFDLPVPMFVEQDQPKADPASRVGQGDSLATTPTGGISVGIPSVNRNRRSFDWQSAWEAARPVPGTRGKSYLERRHIPLAVAEAAGTRFCDNWQGSASLLFPIRDRSGHLVAAQGRAVQGSAKITHGPKKQGAFFAPVLFNERQIFGPLDPQVPAVILTEAPLDALSVATCGFPSLALCGTSGPSWLHLACGLRHVMLAFDADDAGDKAALYLQRVLLPYGTKCERLKPQGFKDWNEWLCADAQAMEEFLIASVR